MKIQFVERKDIDKTKWNSCVHYAINGNIFGYMWYLDNVAKEWDGLVEGDYESVFPLIGRNKYLGVKELYQPALMRESGVYSTHGLSKKRTDAFLEAIPKEYKLIDIHLNEQQQLIPEDYPAIQLKTLKNHHLYLGRNYEKLAANFSPAVVQTIEKANLAGLIPTNSLKPEKIVDFYKEHTRNRKELDRRYHGYLRIMYNLLHRGWGNSSAVLDAKKNVLSVNFFMYSHSKVISLLSATSPEGMQKGADVFLYNMLLHSNADKQQILDFNTAEEFPVSLGGIATTYQKMRLDKRKWGVF